MSGEPEDLLPFEEELSAYLDGALDAEREAQVRAELARSPALAARLAELRELDSRLNALPASPVPGDLRARLQQRIDAEAGAASARAPRASRRRPRWLSAPLLAAAAVAAAVALMVLIGRPVADRRPTQIADQPVPGGSAHELANPSPPSPSPPLPSRAVPTPAPLEPASVDLAAADDEELEIAMDWDMLEDLDVIEELDLLEEMVAQAQRGRG